MSGNNHAMYGLSRAQEQHQQHQQHQHYAHPSQQHQQPPPYNYSSSGSSSSPTTPPVHREEGGTQQLNNATIVVTQHEPGSSSPQQPGGQVWQVVGKTRTSCNFCIKRKKGCEYIEIDGKKQQCKLCKEKQQECIFVMKPPRTGKRKEGASAAQRNGGGASGGQRNGGGTSGEQRNGGGATAGAAASRSSTALVAASSSARKAPSAVMKRARMGPSAATGLVGFEENVFVSDFFDRLGFFPLANQKTVRRAIMEVLFRPAEEQGSFRGGAESMEGVFSGALAIQKFGSNTQESKAFSCILWCTIALGAMTNNLSLPTVRRYVKLAEEAVDGLCTEDVPTAKAYTIMAMVYAWQDNSALFAKYLGRAQELVNSMDASEEIPMELTDIMKELERVRVLHYTEDEDVIHKCCYEADGEPPTMTLAMMSDAGLFHMVRYYTNGVFKAFWRDLHEINSDLPETTRFAEKHRHECAEIEQIANSREGLKNSAGALYIRAAMQFMRLPLKTDPAEALKSSLVLTDIICQVPGMVRYGPLKHYVHCLVMMLRRPAILGVDKGSYEKLRKLYNGLDIAGPDIEAAEDMDMAMLCKHQFCNGMAWIHQEKMLKMKRAQAAAEAAADAGTTTATAVPGRGPGAGAGGGLPVGALGPMACVNEGGAETSNPGDNGSSARGFASGDTSGGSGDAASAASSSPHLQSPSGGAGNRIHHFPQAAAAAAAAAEAGAARSDMYATSPFPLEQSPLPHNAPLSQCRLDDPVAAAPFDGTGASMFSPKQEGTKPFPQARGGSGGGGAGSPDMFPQGWTLNDDLQQGSHQQQRSLGRGALAALHPRGGPSAAAVLAPPQSQQQQQQQWLQERQQQQPQWGGGAPPSPLRNAAGSTVAAGAGAAAPQDMEGIEMPVGLFEFAQNKVRQQQQQQQQESSGHRDQSSLQELLGVDAHDDSRSVPEIGVMDSDAEDFTLVPAGAGAGGEGDSLHSILFSPGEE
ncbi:unnamed protein product [Ectocarpus sp. 12 AP-2014]